MYKYIILILLLPPAIAVSQEIDDTISYSINLDDFVVTAQYEPTHYNKVNHKVRIIKKETIEYLGAVTLDRVLITIPTIRLVKDPILGTSVSLRGISSSNVAILIDGVPVIGRNGGGIDVSQLPMQNVDRIEIIEGPLSNLYGNNAAGGVINIITKSCQKDSWNMIIGSQMESIGQNNYTANLSYQKQKFSLGLNGRYFRFYQYPSDSLRLTISDTVRSNIIYSPKYPFNPKKQSSFGSYIRYQTNPNHHLLLKYDFNSEFVIDYGIKKRKSFNPYAEDKFYITKRNDILLKYKGQFNNKLNTTALLAYNKYNRRRDDKRYYIESMNFDSSFHNTDSIQFKQLFGRVDFNYSKIKNWNIGFGSSYTKESGKGGKITKSQDKENSSPQFSERAGYINLRYTGIKDLEIEITSRGLLHSIYENAWISSFLLKYQISKNMTLRSGVAQGYRSPSITELYLDFIDINHNIIGNENLEPERSIDIQSSIKYTNRDINASLGAYYTSIKKRIALAEYETLKFHYDNVDNYSVFGFQPSLDIRINNLTLSSGGSIGFWSVGIEDKSAPKFGKLIDINNTVVYLVKQYDISLIINHRYTGKQANFRIENKNLLATDTGAYNLIDFSISKKNWNKKMNLSMGVRNILNISKVNNTDVTRSNHNSGVRRFVSPGRSLFLSVSINI